MEIKAIKLRNPDSVLSIADHIEDYVEKVKNVGVLSSTFLTYLIKTVATGGDMAEVWVVTEDSEPKGFIRFNVLPLPYISDICADAIYSWSKSPAVSMELCKTCLNFANRHKAKRIHAYFYDKKVFDYVGFVLKDDLNVDMIQTGAIHGVGVIR